MLLESHGTETLGLPGWLTPQDASSISGRFQLLEQLTAGGMGIVYRARHLRLETDVALKILRHGHSPDRFRREGTMMARVKSPHVVTVHDFDLLPSGAPMIVMEWVDGHDLEREIARHSQVQESRAIRWMRDACQGMIAVEEEGIVHRDLKPSNILLDRRGMARVADFGLARLNEGRSPTLLTTDGYMLGTPAYMPPEQAEHPRSVDTRSDVYSFGATFYHTLTGSPPFAGESYFEVLLKHKLEPLPSPRARCGEISQRINDLLERCLAKSQNDRFQSFREILDHLGTAPPTSPWLDQSDSRLTLLFERYLKRRAEYLGESVRSGELDRFEFPGGEVLRIMSGDIAKQDVDIVVSSDSSDLMMHGGTGSSILARGGPEIAREAARYAPVKPGRSVVTTGGNLPARFVFHAVCMGSYGRTFLDPTRDLIAEVVASCLYHAESINARSIAFPLLGTGAGGFSHEICMDMIWLTLARVFIRGVTPLSEARIVVYSH